MRWKKNHHSPISPVFPVILPSLSLIISLFPLSRAGERINSVSSLFISSLYPSFQDVERNDRKDRDSERREGEEMGYSFTISSLSSLHCHTPKPGIPTYASLIIFGRLHKATFVASMPKVEYQGLESGLFALN